MCRAAGGERRTAWRLITSKNRLPVEFIEHEIAEHSSRHPEPRRTFDASAACSSNVTRVSISSISIALAACSAHYRRPAP